MDRNAFLTPDEAGNAAERAGQVVEALSRVVLGQSTAIRQCVLALLARGHVLLEGPPGTAKTLLVRALSQALTLSFRRIQFTPDLMPSDITGISILSAGVNFTFRPGPLFADLVLADEINRAPAKTQAALLEAMQERNVTVDGEGHPLSPAFTVFATQNPIEFEGTYPLPEAELDRFLIKCQVGYPALDAEVALLDRTMAGFDSATPASYGVQSLLDGQALAALQAATARVRAEPPVIQYLAAVVRATRDAPALTLGGSPRATVALLRICQAAALLDGRAYVIPDDVKQLVAPVLRHRIAVAPELELEGVTADAALATIVDRIEVPRA